MRYNLFMTIGALVALIFGLSFILFPTQTMALYGTTLDVPGQFLGRYLGSAFLGVAVLVWLVRNAPASATRQGIVQGLFVLTVTGFIVAVYDKFAGTGNALVWSTVVIYLLLAVGFGYFSFMKAGSS